MLHFPVKYTTDPQDFSNSRGANQGEWIIVDSLSNIQFIAAKDAGPCVIVFFHGQNKEKNTTHASVAHISVAERVDSIKTMLDAMRVCDSINAILISGQSTAKTSHVKEIIELISKKVDSIYSDLGQKTTRAVLDIKSGQIWKNHNIPKDKYDHFNPDRYFRQAAVGILNPKFKKPLRKAFGDVRIPNFQPPKKTDIIHYNPISAIDFAFRIYIKSLLTSNPVLKDISLLTDNLQTSQPKKRKLPKPSQN